MPSFSRNAEQCCEVPLQINISHFWLYKSTVIVNIPFVLILAMIYISYDNYFSINKTKYHCI